MFKVSVIIPVYNAEKFLAKAIESVLIQPEVTEIILIEDASPDNAIEICKKYVSQYPNRIKLYQHEDKLNKGAAESRNVGIIKASNEYIAFLDADDYYLPNRFVKDKSIFESELSIDGVYSAIQAYAADEQGKERMQKTKKNITTIKQAVPSEELFYKMEPIGVLGYFSLNGLTVKKQALINVGLFDPELRLSQDTHISIKLAAKYKLVPACIDKPVAMFAIHQDNRSQYSEQLKQNRPYLFYDLYKWARAEKLEAAKIFILWQRFYEYNLLVHKLNRLQQRKLLLEEFFTNPRLLQSRFYRKQLPVLSRIMS